MAFAIPGRAPEMGSKDTKTTLAGSGQGEKDSPPMEAACARMKAAGLRVTRPRLAILSALVKRGEPSSVEQIHSELGGSRCDLVTVYRCMAAFEEIGLVRRAVFSGRAGLYVIVLVGGTGFKVVCRRTRRMAAIDPGVSEELSRALERIEDSLREKGYTGLGHVVEFFGTAP
jgi:Fur family ferric uptake transcriptional regulator